MLDYDGYYYFYELVIFVVYYINKFSLLGIYYNGYYYYSIISFPDNALIPSI